MNKLKQLIFFLIFFVHAFSQSSTMEWRVLPIENLPPDKRAQFYKILCSTSGSVILSSTHGLIRYQGFRINFPSVSILADDNLPIEKVKDPHAEDGIKSICRGAGSNLFFLTSDGRIYYMKESLIALTGYSDPPLYIPVNKKGKAITSIWADEDGDLFVGVQNDSLIIIPGAAKHSPADGEMDSSGNFISDKITKGLKKVFINDNPRVYKFSKDIINPHCVLLATSVGLMRLDKKTGAVVLLGKKWDKEIITTGILPEKNGTIWFSTLDQGIGLYNTAFNYSFYNGNMNGLAINSFCKKSANEFFIAAADSLPAIFNITNHTFSFLNDTIFKKSKNSTTDIQIDGFGNLFVLKGGAFFYTNSFSESKKFAETQIDSNAYSPFIFDMLINGRPYFEMIKGIDMLPGLKKIKLKYNQNQLEFSYSLIEYWNKPNTAFAWKLDGLNMDWVNMSQDPQDKFKARLIPPLQPGKYIFRVRAKVGNENWRKQEAALIIIITPAFWKSWWFWTIVGVLVIGLFIFFYKQHISSVRKKERKKIVHERELLEMEAKALRAQMNPHFIFNSLNSIKSLINKNDNEKAAGYLATFSKLIRTLLQNSDKREVSLFEELETCKLYTQLEKMRFGDKVNFIFDIDETIDLKDIKVPALVLQPFIENAIWHGLVPKESGGKVTVTVEENKGTIECVIDDDGIGRELSGKYKTQYEATHQSKGIGLTQSRLELDKLLNEREDSIRIIDKKSDSGIPAGTKVIISFKENEK